MATDAPPVALQTIALAFQIASAIAFAGILALQWRVTRSSQRATEATEITAKSAADQTKILAEQHRPYLGASLPDPPNTPGRNRGWRVRVTNYGDLPASVTELSVTAHTRDESGSLVPQSIDTDKAVGTVAGLIMPRETVEVEIPDPLDGVFKQVNEHDGRLEYEWQYGRPGGSSEWRLRRRYRHNGAWSVDDDYAD